MVIKGIKKFHPAHIGKFNIEKDQININFILECIDRINGVSEGINQGQLIGFTYKFLNNSIKK